MSLPVSITIVVPSFNQGQFIDETIQSLLDQQYPNLEILVLDGGSTDDTVERLQRFGTDITWTSTPDGGQSDAIRKGFSNAKGDWISWLNSDDVQCDRALWRVAMIAEESPTVDVIVGQGHYMDQDGTNPRHYPTIKTGPGVDVAKELFEKGYLAQPSVFFKRATYIRVGGIDPKLDFCMDYDLWVRFALGGATFAACDFDLSGNRWYANTKSAGQTVKLLAEVSATQTRHFGRVSPFFVQSISDNLYQIFHGNHFGDANHIFYRLIYFKTIWIWLNLRRPMYCMRGLFLETICKSGPVVGDKLSLKDLVTSMVRMFRRRLSWNQ